MSVEKKKKRENARWFFTFFLVDTEDDDDLVSPDSDELLDGPYSPTREFREEDHALCVIVL
jgi:hypothetical protein